MKESIFTINQFHLNLKFHSNEINENIFNFLILETNCKYKITIRNDIIGTISSLFHNYFIILISLLFVVFCQFFAKKLHYQNNGILYFILIYILLIFYRKFNGIYYFK
jgi:hypothetical protein